jgi:hypothetical protein
MDLLAEVSIAEGNKPLAYELLQASTQMSPADSHVKWMTLGQLHIELDKSNLFFISPLHSISLYYYRHYHEYI